MQLCRGGTVIVEKPQNHRPLSIYRITAVVQVETDNITIVANPI